MAGLDNTIIGGCHLRRRLGGAGSNDIYLARQIQPEREVAVKVVRAEGSDVRAFLGAARTIANLSHPNIVPLLDVGVERDLCYLVQPYLPAGSLADMLARQTESHLSLPAAPAVVASLVREIAGALQYAHDQGIIHRNLKPENLLADWQPSLQPMAVPPPVRMLLADFDLLPAPGATATSMPGRLPLFLSPEQCRGMVLPASDQYALACIAYLLLTGRLVFTGTVAELHHHHLGTPPTPASQLNPTLPPATDTVLLRALAKDPLQRYPSVATMAEALEAALNPLTQVRQSPWMRAPAPPPALSTALPDAPPLAVSPAHGPRPDADGPAAPIPGLRRRLRHGWRQQPGEPGVGIPAPVAPTPPLRHEQDHPAMPSPGGATRLNGELISSSTTIAPGQDGPAARLPLGRRRGRGWRNVTIAALAAVLALALVAGAVVGQSHLPFGQAAQARQPRAAATATAAFAPTITPPSTATPPPTFKLFTSPHSHLILLQPQGWSELSQADSTGYYDEFYGPQPDAYISISWRYAGPYAGLSNDEIVVNAGSFLGTGTLSQVDRGQITVGHQTCSYGIFTFQGGSPLVVEGLIVGCIVHGRTYEMEFDSSQSSFATFYTGYFGPMLNSLSFTA